jgi:protein-arginine kinase
MGTKINIKTLIKDIEEKQNLIEQSLPYNVSNTFGKIYVMGTQIAFGDNDFKTVEEFKESLEYLVKQFGGTIEWKKNS